MKLITSAQLDNYNNRKDKSITLRFITGEKTPQEVANIHEMLDTYGYLYFKAENQLTSEELKSLDNLNTDLDDKNKSQSKRIKNVLYVAFTQQSEGFNDFETYYKVKTEQFIQSIKDKLD